MVDPFYTYLPVIPLDIMIWIFTYLFIGIGFTLSYSLLLLHYSDKGFFEAFKIEVDSLDEREIAKLILRPIGITLLWLPFSFYLFATRSKHYQLVEV